MKDRNDSLSPSKLNITVLRKPDPRIAALIENALGTAETILNVGAGTGSYEPTDRQVTAVEPSLQMIRQRGAKAATAIQGCAEELPFEDDSFDASMAILTVHHWSDKERGFREMRRVTRGRIVLLTFDPFAGANTARLHRWISLCLLAAPCRLSGRTNPLRQLCFLVAQER